MSFTKRIISKDILTDLFNKQGYDFMVRFISSADSLTIRDDFSDNIINLIREDNKDNIIKIMENGNNGV